MGSLHGSLKVGRIKARCARAFGLDIDLQILHFRIDNDLSSHVSEGSAIFSLCPMTPCIKSSREGDILGE